LAKSISSISSLISTKMETGFNQQQQVLKLRLNNTNQPNVRNGNQNILGEFTRRKNWSSSVLESVRDVLHVLNGDLLIVYCSSASSEFLGYKPSELVDHVFTEYIHVDDVDMFVREFRNCKLTYATFSTAYRFLRKDGKYTTLETRGRFHKNSFFGSARKIPTEAAHSMDSFLDLKMENELLKRKLGLLKNQHNKIECSMNSVDTAPSNPSPVNTTVSNNEDSSDEFDEFMPNASSVYTQGVGANLDIGESLSLFTGLRYDMGERSVGISLGLDSGELTTVGMDQIMSYPTVVSHAENLTQSDQPRLGKKVKKKSLNFFLLY
jgi:PAS domain S-box-containing protein